MSQLLRELSHGEQAFFHGSIASVVMSELEGNVSLDSLQMAFNLLIERHPIFQCKVVRNNERLYFCSDKTIPNQVKTIELESREDAHQIYESAINKGIDASNLLIEVSLLKQKGNNCFYILSNISHIISDGVSITHLNNELLNLCDLLMAGEEDFVRQQERLQPGRSDLPTPIEDYLPPRFDGLSIEAVAEAKKTEVSRVPHSVLAKRGATNKETAVKPHVRVRPYTFSLDQTKQILSWCKQARVSVNNALIASLLQAANKLLPGESSHLLVRQAVNLRQKVDPIIDEGEFITAASSIMSSITVREEQTLERLSNKIAMIVERDIQHTSTSQQHMANKILLSDKTLPLAFHISNVGRLNLDNHYANFELKKYLMLPSSSFGITLPLVITTVDNRLNIITHADERYYPDELLDTLINSVVANICSAKDNEAVVT
jgi:NRPS condensation-like uncharacterized protein